MTTTDMKYITADLINMRVAEVGQAQRQLRDTHPVFRKTFDRSKVRVTVSLRSDGTMVVVDGQHCREAAIRARDTKNYLVMAYEGATPEEEADLFLTLNDSVLVSAVDKFGPRVERGDDDAYEIHNVLHSLGWRVKQQPTKGCIGAVSAVESVYKRGGADLLSRTISVPTYAWDRTSDGVHNMLIRGLGALFSAHPRLDDELLVKALRTNTPFVVRGRAKQFSETMGWSMTTATANALVDIYNKQVRRADKKLATLS